MTNLTVMNEDVLARVRSGDPAAWREVVAPVSGGVRLLLARRLNGEHLQEAIADAHERILLAITDNTIGGLNELPGFVRTILKVQAPTKATQAVKTVDPQAVRNLQEAMSAGELEVLHRHYVLGESTTRISEVTGMNSAAIVAVKRRARQVHQKPFIGGAPVVMPHGLVA